MSNVTLMFIPIAIVSWTIVIVIIFIIIVTNYSSIGFRCVTESQTRQKTVLDRGQTDRISLTHDLDIDLRP